MIALAMGALYIVWGSTYLGILIAIETLPPFAMAAVRSLIAGTLLYAWSRARGAAAPTGRQWGNTALLGGLLLLGGNGGVVWAEQRVPSGLAALVVATVPLWMVWMQAGLTRLRPGRREMAGVALGLVGVVLLVGPIHLGGQTGPDPLGVAVLLAASLSWALGSVISRRLDLPSSSLLSTAMQMLGGGALLGVVSVLAGEPGHFDPAAVSTRSWLALVYLIIFGSLVGFSAYVWLLRVARPSLVSTYAYVNPLVAVFLGWMLAGEAVTSRTLTAAAVIVSAVALITFKPRVRVPVQPAD